MADRELAAKLEKRLAKLSFDTNGNASIFSDEASVPQTLIPSAAPPPPPPPPPSQKQQTPPFRIMSNDECTDMDKLIGEALHGFQLTSAKASKNPPPSMDNTSELFKKRLPATGIFNEPLKVQLVDDPDSNQRSDSPLLSPKWSAPVVPIVHHKNNYQQPKNLLNDEFALQKERNELEAKLAKQRQKRPITSTTTTEFTTSTAITGICIPEQPDIILEKNRSQSIPSIGSSRPPVLPKKISIDLDSTLPQKTELQRTNSQTPPSTPRKPASSITMSQASSSPTCSTISVASASNNEFDELAAKLARRNMIAEGEPVEPAKPPKLGIYSEFHEFSRKQIKYFMETFKKYDEDRDNFINFNELKRMMEKLGEAQTHIALKNMLKLVDEDRDGKVSLREFMLIFRYAATGQLSCAEVFNELAASVDVSKEGVHAAADFFQAKIEEQKKLSKFEEEIRAEQEERKQQEAEKKERRQQFLANKAVFI